MYCKRCAQDGIIAAYPYGNSKKHFVAVSLFDATLEVEKPSVTKRSFLQRMFWIKTRR